MEPSRLASRLVVALGLPGPLLLALGAVLLAVWLVALRGLHEGVADRWLAVPVLLLGGAICLCGPLTGPALLRLSPTRTLVLLDPVGLALGGTGLLLGARALRARRAARSRARAGRG